MGMDFFGQQRFAAFGAYHHGIERLPALAMLMQQRPPAFVGVLSSVVPVGPDAIVVMRNSQFKVMSKTGAAPKPFSWNV